MSTILAVDPGRHAGWAVYGADGLLASGAARAQKPADVVAALERIHCALHAPAPISCRRAHPLFSHCAIEDQYPGPNRAWGSIRTLVRRAAWWEARVVDWTEDVAKTEYIAADEWQRAVLSVSGPTRRAERARLALLVASKLAEYEIADPNEAAAICLGNYAVRREMARIALGRERSKGDPK